MTTESGQEYTPTPLPDALRCVSFDADLTTAQHFIVQHAANELEALEQANGYLRRKLKQEQENSASERKADHAKYCETLTLCTEARRDRDDARAALRALVRACEDTKEEGHFDRRTLAINAAKQLLAS